MDRQNINSTSSSKNHSAMEEECERILAKKEKKLNILLELNLRMAGKFDLNSLLHEIMRTVRDSLKAEGCSIVLLDEDKDELYFYLSDDPEADLTGITLKRGQGIVGKVIETGDSIIVNDTSSHPLFYKGVDVQSGIDTRCLVCTPMKIANRVIGAIEVVNSKDKVGFSDEDTIILEILGTQSALAIEYIQFYEKRMMDERLSIMGRLAAQYIHDLKNSMHRISGLAQVMIMEHPDLEKYGDHINHEIDSVRDMAADILAYSRGELSKCDLKPVSLHRYINKLYDNIRNYLTQENVESSLAFVDEDTKVLLDENRMERALLNLIKNSIEAFDKDTRQIIIGTRNHEKGPCVFIKDSGSGMTRDIIRKIYEPFFTSGKKNGTGLGMTIVKSIVKGHGGEIIVNSQEGKGTEFLILLKPV